MLDMQKPRSRANGSASSVYVTYALTRMGRSLRMIR
jgi:hypothetical protein